MSIGSDYIHNTLDFWPVGFEFVICVGVCVMCVVVFCDKVKLRREYSQWSVCKYNSNIIFRLCGKRKSEMNYYYTVRVQQRPFTV